MKEVLLLKNHFLEPISKVFADDEKMIVDVRHRAALSGFTRCGKARNAGQVGYGERFSAPQRVLKLAPCNIAVGTWQRKRKWRKKRFFLIFKKNKNATIKWKMPSLSRTDDKSTPCD